MQSWELNTISVKWNEMKWNEEVIELLQGHRTYVTLTGDNNGSKMYKKNIFGEDGDKM